ncbi:MAG TPA: PBP1A family penicillin-binding protein [Candidatus Megaira endosymbiont of Nemacystus decipiens]|nr:PBP1A family penicillin-binding protein [Candidatus Megaera endosymbiont of Nemacystus decipiens]
MLLNLIRLIVKHFLKLVTILILIIAYILFYYSKDLPSYSDLEKYYPPSITRLYSADGKLIEEFAKERRVFVPIKSIPKQLIYAFVSAEDKNFYTHYGIDVLSIIRAAGANIANILYNRRVEGGSTITQQVVKNFLLSSTRSLERKIKEAILSYRITQSFSKEQVMELYLNQIFLGKGSYGVAMAALNYFNKSIEELTLSECAVLASLPKAPSKFNPERNMQRAISRKNYVIERMYEEGYISLSQAQEAKAEAIILKKRDKITTIDADYYASKVRQEVISMFGEEYFYNAGLTIITCLDSKIQEAATNALRFAIKKHDMKRGYRGPIAQQINMETWLESLNKIKTPVGLLHYKLAAVLHVEKEEAKIGLVDGTKATIYLKDSLWTATNIQSLNKILKPCQVIAVEKIGNKYFLQQIPDFNGGFMVMNHQDGRVLAIQGGYDFDSSRFDRTTQAKRQVGSLIKPFVYLAALENGARPNDIFIDEPIQIEQGPNLPLWEPRNYERNFMGPMTLRKGFEKSRNIISIKVGLFAGLENVRQILIRLGVNNKPPHYNSLFLGAIETTLAQMVNAFGQIANGGYKIEPHYIEMIKDRFGNIIYKRDYSECYNCSSTQDHFNEYANPSLSQKPKNSLIDEASSYQLISLMKGSVQRGTSGGTRVLKQIVAGKTGTTNGAKDLWFMGFTPEIVAGTYIGYDNPRTFGDNISGARVALPAFVYFMQHAYKDNKAIDFKIPKDIYIDMIDPDTGKRHNGEGAIMEAFKKQDYIDEIDDRSINNISNPDEDRKSDFDKIEDYDYSHEIY